MYRRYIEIIYWKEKKMVINYEKIFDFIYNWSNLGKNKNKWLFFIYLFENIEKFNWYFLRVRDNELV